MFPNLPKIPPLLSLGFALGCMLVMFMHYIDFPQTFNPYPFLVAVAIAAASYVLYKDGK